MHRPIEQQVILLSRASDNELAGDFMRYLRSQLAIDVIADHGYKVSR